MEPQSRRGAAPRAEARKFAEETGLEKIGLREAAHAAGLLHDLGKYQQEFQSYLQASAKKEPHPKVPHAPLGAASAFALMGLANGLAIAGHHQGLPDMATLRRYAKECEGRKYRIWDSATDDCPELKSLQRQEFPQEFSKDPLCSDVLIRMLFSCLVDADWCDTNAWKEGYYPYEYSPLALEPNIRFAALDKHVRDKSSAGEVNAIRRQVYGNCIRAGREGPGFYTLTVPTGGGKTLASLAFALTHCAIHENAGGPLRIIYVIPYLNILEQTANVFYEALGIPADAHLVFEHHSLAYVDRPQSDQPPATNSNAETEPESAVSRRMEENWEAPIILTTSVQFFESLFSNRPAAARKLHHIARSVVIFDECQTFPESLYRPTLSVLKELVSHWGVTFVFCTATQPALREEYGFTEGIAAGDLREIMTDPAPDELFRHMHRMHNGATVPRVTVKWPWSKEDRVTWEELAAQMENQRQALAIVNIKAHARKLFEALGGKPGDDCPDTIFYLSTLMCAAHRRRVLKEIRRRLDPKVPLPRRERCLVASTQLVEAGVDFDFPAVFRAFGPLDAVGQAAGRCNREGRLADECGQPISGKMVVFRPLVEGGHHTEYPPGYSAGVQVCEELLAEALLQGSGPNIFDPATYVHYFSKLAALVERDAKDIQGLRKRLDFPAVATEYQLIDSNTQQVVVPYNPDSNTPNLVVQEILRSARARGYLTLQAARSLQPYLVNLWPNEFAKAQSMRLVCPIIGEWWEWIGRYDLRCGLIFDFDILPVV